MIMLITRRTIILFFAFLFLVTTTLSSFASAPVKIRFKARTPDQTSSFYEARGFPKEMINIIKQQCFITTGVHNTSNDVVWLEMENWQFNVDGNPVTRLTRAQWKQKWSAIGIPLSKQATFHWTQIPDVLDLLPDEKEGGNIILPRTNEPISITAKFLTGRDKQGKPYTVRFDNIYCAKD